MSSYPNYHISVEGLILYKDKILLCKRNHQALVAPGVWNVPAGKVKLEEIPLHAIYREIKEETNLDVESVEEIHVSPSNQRMQTKKNTIDVSLLTSPY